MKYIVEADERSELVQVISVMPNGTVYTNERSIDELEELNSDYINEHFSELQDTAYQKGLEDGKQTAVGAAELREKLEYQKGFNDGKAQVERGCEGCEYEHRGDMGTPCEYCSKNFKNLWKAKDDKIEVGDEVNWSGDCFIVTRIFQPRNMKEQCDGIDDDGCVYHDVLMDDLTKTGRHFDIASILEDMRND